MDSHEFPRSLSFAGLAGSQLCLVGSTPMARFGRSVRTVGGRAARKMPAYPVREGFIKRRFFGRRKARFDHAFQRSNVVGSSKGPTSGINDV